MECGVCIGGGDFDGTYEFSTSVTRKARKDYRCYECYRAISKGSQYHYFSGKYDGYLDQYRTCLDCHNIRIGLTCEGEAWPAFGNLWDDVTYSFRDLRSTACLTKIKTPSAKEYFLDRWRAWKFKENTSKG